MLRLDFEETGDLFPDEIVELRHWLAGLLDEGWMELLFPIMPRVSARMIFANG